VDERVAGRDDPDRTWTGLERRLVAPVSLPADRTHPMPVEAADLAAATRSYAELLARLAGTPPVLDLVQLGLGADGHTASLVPGDPVLRVRDADVALAGPYAGRRRMTLTFPALDRSRRVLWIVCGAGKADVLVRFVAADPSLPASAVRRDRALLLADRAAAARLPAWQEGIVPEPERSPTWPDPSPTTR
jgi:6-phosphogluconolactonase/glucosamine-6-phosphate isomerase/deaminase